jgi:hypothetical protein
MPRVWLPLLDQTGTRQDKHIRRQSPGISVPGKEVRRDCSMGGEMTRVTVVGAILIAAMALLILVVIQALSEEMKRKQNKSDL